MGNGLKIGGVAACLVAAGCAKNPDAISPATIPYESYLGKSCEELGREHAAARARLDALSAEQRSAATGDALGVFLIGVPVSSVAGGDKEGQIAVAKGTVLALDDARRAKGCKG